MKQLFARIVILSILILAFFFMLKIVVTLREKEKIQEKIEEIPSFLFYKDDGSFFSRDSVSNYLGRLIIGSFSPDCEHCQYMAEKWVNEKEKFEGTEIILVTNSDKESVRKFYLDNKLEYIPALRILFDHENEFYKTFGTSVTPSFFVYKNGSIVNKFIGTTLTDSLLSNHSVKD